jgi:hypothetical protein
MLQIGLKPTGGGDWKEPGNALVPLSLRIGSALTAESKAPASRPYPRGVSGWSLRHFMYSLECSEPLSCGRVTNQDNDETEKR